MVDGSGLAWEAGDWEVVAAKLGFDFEWSPSFGAHTKLMPPFEEQVIAELPDGSRKVLNKDGTIVIEKDDATGIPSEIDHILKGRKEWEEHYLPRLRFSAERLVVDDEKLAYLRRGEWKSPLGVSVGSLYGEIRDYLGLVNSAYLQVDDPALFDEMIGNSTGGSCWAWAGLTSASLPATMGRSTPRWSGSGPWST